MITELEKIMEENQIVVLVLPDEQYSSMMTALAKNLSNIYDKICYITQSKIFSNQIETLKKVEVKIEKFHFIDTITATATKPEETDNCTFISSPSALTDLDMAISDVIRKHNSEILFFDSVTSLLVYNKSDVVRRFIHTLTTELRVLRCKTIFTYIEKEKDLDLIKDLDMLADKIVHLEQSYLFRT